MNDHDIGCECSECVLDAWSMPDSSKRFRDAAREIRELRGLVDEQIQAMNNGPMGDLNYAGVNWLQRAKKAREPVESSASPQPWPDNTLTNANRDAASPQVTPQYEWQCMDCDFVTRNEKKAGDHQSKPGPLHGFRRIIVRAEVNTRIEGKNHE